MLPPLVLWDRVLCSPGWVQTCFAAKAGLELLILLPPSQVLGLQVSTPSGCHCFLSLFPAFSDCKTFFLGLFYVYECFANICICVPHACLVPVRFRKGCSVPGTGVMDGCEPPLGIGNWTQVLCKPTSIQALSHLSSPWVSLNPEQLSSLLRHAGGNPLKTWRKNNTSNTCLFILSLLHKMLCGKHQVTYI